MHAMMPLCHNQADKASKEPVSHAKQQATDIAMLHNAVLTVTIAPSHCTAVKDPFHDSNTGSTQQRQQQQQQPSRNPGRVHAQK